MDKWQILDVKEEYCEKLESLTQEIYKIIWKRSASKDYYKWKYFKGGNENVNALIAYADDKAVGCQGSWIKKFRFGQISKWGIELSDAMVHPDFRRQGMWEKLAKKLVFDLTKKKYFPICGFPQKYTLPGWKKISFEIFLNVQRLGLILKPEAIIYFKKLPYWVAWIMTKTYNNIRRIRYISWLKKKSNVIIERNAAVGDWVDLLWVEESVYNEVGVVKDSEYLKWRFEENPDSYHIYRAKNMEGISLGYLVTKIREDGNKLKFGFIADFLVPSRNKSIFRLLLLEAEKDFQKENVSFVDVWSTKHPYYYRCLISYGFIPIAKLPFIVPRNQGDQLRSEGWDDHKKWVLTMADTDNI